MIIKNSTPWRTEDLRKIFNRCVQDVDRVEKPNNQLRKRKEFSLDILNSDRFCGKASRWRQWIMVKIPRGMDWNNPITKNVDFWKENNPKRVFAHIIIHEYYHILGYKYQDKMNYKFDTTKQWDVSWVDEYLIREKEVVKKEVVDIKLLRYQRAIQNLCKAETRFKRAKTLYGKWTAKVKRYEVVYNFKRPN